MAWERDDTGPDTRAVTPEDVLGAFEAVEGPVVTSGDVADHLECSRETAGRKLQALEEQDNVASRKTAGRVVWWLVDGTDAGNEIEPDDPFWDLEPVSSGERDVSETVDETLYGDA